MRVSGPEAVLIAASCCLAMTFALSVHAAAPVTEASLADEVRRSIAKGPVQPTLESLAQFETPEWFRDAKFGIWSHWGPQSVSGQGDWYARSIYMQGHPAYEQHLKVYGHPSQVGYKDMIPLWKAEKFDPDRLMRLYKQAGARYFMSMGVHHDNFDLWDSKYHRWNAVKMGPKRDIVGDWARAARKEGLRFAVSEHLGPSYSWFQTSHGADKEGPLKGVPYDGADPKYADLYHTNTDTPFTDAHSWLAGDPAWHLTWFRRIKDLVDRYQPDMLYTDGGIPFGNTGRSLIAHMYNDSIRRHGGTLEAIYTCKDMGAGEFRVGSCLQDIERQGMNGLSPLPWQTDTSVGDWFYNVNWKYTPTGEIIRFFVDIVSKNGNLLLNVVQRPDGELDPEAEQFLREMAQWNAINGEAIFATRPWLTYGEGPAQPGSPLRQATPFSARDIRYTQSKDGSVVYAFALGWPTQPVTLASTLVKSVGRDARVTLLGSEDAVPFEVNTWGQLVLKVPTLDPARRPGDHAFAFKLTGFDLDAQPEAKAAGSVRTLQLALEKATTESDQWQLGSVDGTPALVAWGEPKGPVHWFAKVTHPGRYRVAVNVQAPDGPSSIVFDVDGKAATIDVPDTGATQRPVFLQTVEIDIPETGIHHIVMKATDPARYKRVHVFKVYLVPQT